MSYKLSSTFLLFFNDLGFVAVDTKLQKYYQLSEQCIDRLKNWAINYKSLSLDLNLDKDLINTGLLEKINNEDDTNNNWLGDKLFWLFYHSTRNHSTTIPKMNEDEFIENYLNLSKEVYANHNLHNNRNSFKKQSTSIKLPFTNLGDLHSSSLLDSLKRRKTCRNFLGKPMDISQLSTLLFSAFGFIHGSKWDEFSHNNMLQLGHRKSSPSASGLHACGAYVSILRVDGIKNGLYFYNSEEHALELIKEGCADSDIEAYVCDQFWSKGLAAGIFITVDLDLVWAKDRKVRALPVAYLEAGHFSQTLQLCSATLGLQTWITGTFRDDVVSLALNLDASRIFPVAFVGFGHGTDEAIPQKFKKKGSLR